jgi:hexosaminidase
MLYPRMQAVAEAAWTTPNNREWLSFLSRLKVDLMRFDQRGMHYRDPWHPEPYTQNLI